MRKSLADDPAVTGLAHTLGISIQEAIGSLYLLWCYADSHAVDGCVSVTPKRYRSVTVENLNRTFGRNGFAETLEEIGWLQVHDDRIAFPKFERHMSQSAKERALTKKRVATYRNEPCNGRPLPEKRREEKSITPVVPVVGFDDFWQAYPARDGRKRGKAKCQKLYANVPKSDRPLVVVAAKNYAVSGEVSRGFAKDPERFFRDDWWRDWLAEASPQSEAVENRALTIEEMEAQGLIR